jgi:hypothetical protein
MLSFSSRVKPGERSAENSSEISGCNDFFQLFGRILRGLKAFSKHPIFPQEVTDAEQGVRPY